MDFVPPTQSDLRRGELFSPVRGTRTRAVREYEETIDKLNKEKFDLQLRLYLLEENRLKNPENFRGGTNEELDHKVDIIVNMRDENEVLKKELDTKDQLIHEALDQAKRNASDLKEFQERCAELQRQLTSVSNIPLQVEREKLKDEKDYFEKENDYLKNTLSETEKLFQEAKAQIDELTSKNEALEAKVDKRNKAIQGLAFTCSLIPIELRPIVQGAVQAAKQCKVEDLDVAMRELRAVLIKIMHASVEEFSNDLEQKENEIPSRDKLPGNEPKKSPSAIQSLRDQSSRQGETKPKFVNVRKCLFKPK